MLVRPYSRLRCGARTSMTAAAVALSSSIGVHSAGADELDINGDPNKPPVVEWTLVNDSPVVTEGARIGSAPEQSGELIVGEGVEWTNHGGFFLFIDGQNVWTDGVTDDLVGLLIGSPAELSPFVGDEPSVGKLTLKADSVLNSTGNTWIGAVMPVFGGSSDVKTGEVVIEAGATWNNVGQPFNHPHLDDIGQASGFWVRNGSLTIEGELISQSGTQFGAEGGTVNVDIANGGSLLVALLDESATWRTVQDSASRPAPATRAAST
jgi:hypothetical protein